ncbi:MAG: agmatine deiminase family protein [Alphaproteobacteria bacterium]|nr:agmatine deiminase family protein [Alphaproteobacteria bacterium]
MTPRASGFHQPAEWAPHAATWVGWPWDETLWQDALADAQHEVRGLVEAFTAAPTGADREEAWVLVPDRSHEATARQALMGLPVRFVHAPFGDIWLRDIAPVYVVDGQGRVGSVRFDFNGWGGKYDLPGDAELARRLQDHDDLPAFHVPIVLEGGSVEVDGEGTVLTTRQCLLHPNRNPGLDQAAVEAALHDALGTRKVLWLDEGLLNDHTDGHVDTIARFVAPGVVVCMAPSGPDDPNAQVLERIAADLAAMTDAAGRALQVVRIPSPGRVVDGEGRIMPASHVNFLIADHAVVVPVYGTPWDEAAVAALAPCFPGRTVVGRRSRAILEGGGAFHCITQQVPRLGQGGSR